MIPRNAKDDSTHAVARALRALGHPTRLRLVHRLSVDSFCVSELQQAVRQSQSNVSQHLRILRDCGVVRTERRGNAASYLLADEGIKDLLALAESLFAAPKKRRS